MEIVVELLWMLGRIVLEILAEVAIEAGLAGFKEAFGRRNHSRFAATCGYLLLGGLLGAVSILVWPEAIFARRSVPRPGLSLVLSPFAGALAMQAWGRYRASRGHATTNLATYYGGAALAFGFALVRLIWTR